MGEITLKEALLALSGAVGVILGLIKVFNLVTVQLDKRKQHRRDDRDELVADAVELRRLKAEEDGTLVNNLWRLIGEKNVEIAQLKQELDEADQHSSLSRPTITAIYQQLRAMRREVESLAIMRLNDEEYNVFARRFEKVKECLDEIEYKLMP